MVVLLGVLLAVALSYLEIRALSNPGAVQWPRKTVSQCALGEALWPGGGNFQILVEDAEALYGRIVKAGFAPLLPLEDRWYRQGEFEAGNRQFVACDPDGYLLRFYTDLGRRSVQK